MPTIVNWDFVSPATLKKEQEQPGLTSVAEGTLHPFDLWSKEQVPQCFHNILSYISTDSSYSRENWEREYTKGKKVIDVVCLTYLTLSI